MKSAVGVAALERVEALITNPALYELASLIPEQDRSRGGRPRMYPVFMWLLFDALLSVYGSARQVEVELAHPLVWRHLRRLVRDQHPDDPDVWLPATPMRRHHYLYGRTRWLTDPQILAELRGLHRRLAVDHARQLGLLDPDGPGSWTHPDWHCCIDRSWDAAERRWRLVPSQTASVSSSKAAATRRRSWRDSTPSS